MRHREVAEAFARGETKGSGSRMFIEGDTVYSYGRHFPIARRVSADVVVCNSNGYSGSTARHKSYVKSALCGSGHTVIFVPDCKTDAKSVRAQMDVNDGVLREVREKKGRARTERMREVYAGREEELCEQQRLLREVLLQRASGVELEVFV